MPTFLLSNKISQLPKGEGAKNLPHEDKHRVTSFGVEPILFSPLRFGCLLFLESGCWIHISDQPMF